MPYYLTTPIACSETERDIDTCMERWKARDWGYDYNVQTRRRDNMTLSVAERGVTLWWVAADESKVRLVMDAQVRPRDNLRVLFLAADSMRLNEKRGIDPKVMRSAYLQLTSGEDNPYTILGVQPGSTPEEVGDAYREAARKSHPDRHGGSEAAMAKVNRAHAAVRALEGWA